MHGYFCTLVVLAAAGSLLADDPVVFKSDVALSRVDAQVVDRNGRAITGLQARDFVLRVDGKVTPIKNFDSESMPIDILLLLDVSGSMRPHVQRIADAAQQAFNVLAEQDRLAIMVFDTRTRERLPFTNSRSDVTKELNHLVRSEGFNGGTRITTSMIDAANYVKQHARPDARRAVVVLTDDETQDSEDEARVESALARANAVLSFLQAPYEPNTARGPGRGGRRGGGIGFPGGGGGIGFPGGGGGWPGSGGGGWPGGNGGGGGYPGGRGQADPSHSAGTDTIARESGGDTMSVDDASALEDTLARLRQRYALHFYLAEEAQSQAHHNVRVDLTTEARIRFSDAEVKSRRVFMSGDADSTTGPTVVTHQTMPADPTPIEDPGQPTLKRRRVAVNEDSSGPVVSTVDSQSTDSSGQSQPQTAPTQTAPESAPASAPAKGGWPKATAPNNPFTAILLN
jgi:VWFA-related protein